EQLEQHARRPRPETVVAPREAFAVVAGRVDQPLREFAHRAEATRRRRRPRFAGRSPDPCREQFLYSAVMSRRELRPLAAELSARWRELGTILARRRLHA